MANSANGKRPLTAKEDLAESRRRAKAARTPIAKAVTKRVVEAKERAYSGKAAREDSAQMRRGVNLADVGTPAGQAAARAARPARAGSHTRK